MARYEGDLRTANGTALELEQLLAMLDHNSPAQQAALESARACYLSSGEGWRDAVKHLGGAFAEELKDFMEEQGE